MNVVLYGLPMCGKSYWGEKLSRHLENNFIDTDSLIENAYFEATKTNLTCRELCIKEGEPVFREWERKIIRSLTSVKDSVIAVGGGTMVCPENAANLKTVGILIYLEAPLSLLLERLKKRQHGYSYLDASNSERSFENMVAKRVPIYESLANHTVDITLKEEEIINHIVAKIIPL